MRKKSSGRRELPEPVGLSRKPADPGADAPVFLGDLDIRIAEDGIWYYHGEALGRKELVCLLAATLTPDGFGGFWLVTPAEVGRIQVDDAPFSAVELFTEGSGRSQVLSLRTNVDEIVTVGADHPLRTGVHPESDETRLYVGLRPQFEARVAGSVYNELLARGEPEIVGDARAFGVWSSGTFFRLEPAKPSA